MPGISKDELRRLKAAVPAARKALQKAREFRVERIKERVGTHYSENGASQRTPLNLLGLALAIHLRQLAGGELRALVSTDVSQLRPAADDLKEAANVLIGKKINLMTTMRRTIAEGYFGAGVVKIGLNRSATVEIGGYQHDVGQPFVDTVSLDDFVYDTTAKRWEQITFAGNYYRMPLEDVKTLIERGYYKNPGYNITPDEKKDYNEHGGDEKATTVSGLEQANNEEFTDHVELLDLWLPRQNRFITVLARSDEFTILRDVEWTGPENGPYRILYLDEVPDNVLPFPPSALWLDLHRLANRLVNKLGDQADRQKSLLMFRRGDSEEDGKTVRDAKDGDAVGVDQPDGVTDVSYGGPDQVNLAFLLQTRDLFSWIAGNLDTLGGLAPMADTLGQESILDQNTSRLIEDMQDRVMGFVKDVVNDLCWYMWTDPLIYIPIVKRLPGFDIQVPSAFTADQREGDFLDYNIDIDPYAIKRKSPSEQMQKLGLVLERFVMPLLPYFENQGITIDAIALRDIIGELANLPEINRLLKFVDPKLQAQFGEKAINPNQGGGQPQNTTRTYNRVSQSTGGTRTGRDQANIQQLLGLSKGKAPAPSSGVGQNTGGGNQ